MSRLALVRMRFLLLLSILLPLVLSTTDPLAHLNLKSAEAQQRIQEEINRLDPNHEHLSKPSPLPADQESIVWFHAMDKDGDQLLDGNELVTALTGEVDLKEAIEHIDYVLAEDDLNGDGKISFQEFLAAEQKH